MQPRRQPAEGLDGGVHLRGNAGQRPVGVHPPRTQMILPEVSIVAHPTNPFLIRRISVRSRATVGKSTRRTGKSRQRLPLRSTAYRVAGNTALLIGRTEMIQTRPRTLAER